MTMSVTTPQVIAVAKRGITLLEVIISLGILSVGLASVVALIPAGGAQAMKTVVEDRRGAMAAAALADVVTRGMLDKSRWTTSPSPPYLIDPIGNGSFAVPGLNAVTVTGLAPGPAAEEVFRAQDDLVYVVPDNDDEPAVPKYFTGTTKRLTEGNFSWLATLVPIPSGTTFYRLSVIEFHRRQASRQVDPFPVTSGTDSYLSLTIPTSMTNDDFKSLFPVGTVVLCTGTSATAACEWRRVVMAPLPHDDGVGGKTTELTINGNVPVGVTKVYAIEGAVGLAERTVRLEETSPWSQ